MQTTNRVEVYKNLRLDCWSVRDLKTGKVIDHPNQIYIKDAQLVVRPAGRDKVLKTRQKNVHAFVRGYVDLESGKNNEGCFWRSPNLWLVRYNPYSNDSFVIHANLRGSGYTESIVANSSTSLVFNNMGQRGTPIYKADRVCLVSGKVFAEVN